MSPENDIYRHLSCEWTIFAKPDKAIQFEIIYVRIEDSPSCEFFYLQVSSNRCINRYALTAGFQLIYTCNQYKKNRESGPPDFSRSGGLVT